MGVVNLGMNIHLLPRLGNLKSYPHWVPTVRRVNAALRCGIISKRTSERSVVCDKADCIIRLLLNNTNIHYIQLHIWKYNKILFIYKIKNNRNTNTGSNYISISNIMLTLG